MTNRTAAHDQALLSPSTRPCGVDRVEDKQLAEVLSALDAYHTEYGFISDDFGA